MAFITCSKCLALPKPSKNILKRVLPVLVLFLGMIFLTPSVFAVKEFLTAAQTKARRAAEAAKPKEEAPKTNVFAEEYFMRPEQKISFKATDVQGINFVPTPNRARRAAYSVVTDFQGAAMKTQYISGPQTQDELKKWVKDNLKRFQYKGVEVKRLTLSAADGGTNQIYVVGHRAFKTPQDAKKHIEATQKQIESKGGDFKAQVKEAQTFFFPPPPEPTEGEKAQFEKEERVALKYLDQLDIGNKLFGPLQGTPSGEPILWQSFGEQSWRLTNLENPHYNASVGFFTNRFVFKGIKAPFNTVDPYVEATASMDGTGIDFKSNLMLAAGLEWRPFVRSTFLSNFAPWSLHLLDFVKNYRVFIQYLDRKNIKDEIVGSKNYDWQAGLNIFYEWGIDIRPLGESEACCNVPDYIRRYIWLEYYGNYYFSHTGFAAEDDFNAFIWNSNITLGFKVPGIPLPANPINDELVFMPYVRFEHVNNSEFSFYYQNQYLVAAGIRMMPFMTYRYKDNQWLAKMKIFVEYVGIGKAKNWKQDDEAPYIVDYDLRAGVNFSSNRR